MVSFSEATGTALCTYNVTSAIVHPLPATETANEETEEPGWITCPSSCSQQGGLGAVMPSLVGFHDFCCSIYFSPHHTLLLKQRILEKSMSMNILNIKTVRQGWNHRVCWNMTAPSGGSTETALPENSGSVCVKLPETSHGQRWPTALKLRLLLLQRIHSLKHRGYKKHKVSCEGQRWKVWKRKRWRAVEARNPAPGCHKQPAFLFSNLL